MLKKTELVIITFPENLHFVIHPWHGCAFLMDQIKLQQVNNNVRDYNKVSCFACQGPSAEINLPENLKLHYQEHYNCLVR